MREMNCFWIVTSLAVFAIALTAEAQIGSTWRVSVSSDGGQGNDWSWFPSISADGRFVAFESGASNLVPEDTNGRSDVFVHDRQTGQTTRVSVSSTGEPGNDDSRLASISADGRFVAFESEASNLVSGDTNARLDVFVRDRQTGQTTRVSVSSTGEQGNNVSGDPSISADGRFVAFESWSSNLVPGDTNNWGDVFVHDRQTGETTRVSVSSTGGQGNLGSYDPSISADGRFVAFGSDARNLVPGDTNNLGDVFVHDRQTGQTARVSVSSTGEQGNSGSAYPSISADGRFVAFDSSARNLVPGDTNGWKDVFVHDRQAGQTARVSVSSAGEQGNFVSWRASISADGRFVAFESEADNLVSGDTNRYRDVFVHDRQTGETTRVSVSSSGEQGNSVSRDPSINADGRFVAFASYASNLVPGDTNGEDDIFVHGVPQALLPESVQVVRGQFLSGALADLFASDDRYFNVAARRPTEVAAASSEIVLTGISPTETPTGLGFRVEAAADDAPTLLRVELFDFRTGTWEQIGEVAGPTTDALFDFVAVGNLSRFVQPGTGLMRARIGFHDRGVTVAGWNTRYDQGVWLVMW